MRRIPENFRFAYDAFERRVWRNLPQGEGVHHFVFLPDGRLLGEYEGSTGAVVREYVWMDDRLVGSVDAAGTLTYLQTGPLGQPLLAMNASGLVIWRGELSPFGKLVSSSFGAVPEARFLGQWDEAGSGLYQNWHRTYEASLGRYLEADPLGLAAGQSLYGYVARDPVNAVDPWGLKCIATGGIAVCTNDGYPTVSFPVDSNWPGYIGEGSPLYHFYDKTRWLGKADPICVLMELIQSPTPGSPKPATKEGTPNDATPDLIDPYVYNPVKSYLVNGGTVVVNATQPGHNLYPGYVARYVGGTTVHNFGEGTGALQASLSPFGGMINDAWYGLTDEILEKCSCAK